MEEEKPIIPTTKTVLGHLISLSVELREKSSVSTNVQAK